MENGLEGSERLQFYQYDLAILDWEVPGMSGPEICKKFREGGGRIPVLMLTGKNTIDDKERGLDASSMGDALPFVDLGSGHTAKSLAAGRHSVYVGLQRHLAQ